MDDTLDLLLERDTDAIAGEIAGRLSRRTASVFRSRGAFNTARMLTALLHALRRDLAAGGTEHLRTGLRDALAGLTDDAISFRDLRLLGEATRTALRARCRAADLSAAACDAVDDWCFELALQIGLRITNLRDDLIIRQATEIELKLAEQRQLSRIVSELRQEVREAKQFGQYTLVAKIGEGGMGRVYEARHALLRRPTAIKLLSPERTLADDLRRFEREVRQTARLTHPNTVTIFDFGRTPEGVFYYAMELLSGGSLEDVVEVGGRQPAARVVHVLQAVAGALCEAHGIGLIHRDIKPANIMLCEKGGEHDIVKILDFGLVKELRTDGNITLTQDSQLTGTPYYMAPEVIRDPQHLDPRSDIYALGAVGYYLLTGRNVFEGRTSIEVLSHHLHSEPVAPSVRLGEPVPADLEAVLLDCLKKDPAQRPPGADELRRRLQACRDVGPWPLADARKWWDRHTEAVRARRKIEADAGSGSTIDVAVHVLRRS
jgi:hypothetical protein